MKQAKDFWAFGRRHPSDGWPKDASGEPEKAVKLTLRSELNSSADITLSILESCGIPAFKVGDQGRVVLGFTGLGVEIYVPASRLEEAQALLESSES